MMTLRAVHAGTGYQYLMRSVATNDAAPEAGQSLSDYYAAKGTPPGRWIGSGLAGLRSESAAAGLQVTEEQMAALYGEGLHPDTDEMMREGAPLAACKLGRAFPMYSGDKPVLVALAAAEKQFQITEGRRPTVSERGELAEKIGRPFYMESGGYSHASGADVIAWVNRERDQVKQAVAGYDFTFSPVKSVSVLWALSDEQTASQIAALHHEAVAEALAWAEDNALYTRQGRGGIEQVKTRGLIGSEFTHFDTRGGDPDLHSHVLLSNKVQAPDGSWKALDGQAIFQLHQAISARYDTALHDRLSRRLGVEFQAHYPSPDKAPVWEVKGVDRRLVEAFSSRRTHARPVYDRLVAEYVETHGRQPSQRAAYALWQKAILDTRDAKKPAKSLAEHREQWRTEAVERIGTEAVDGLLERVRVEATGDELRPVFDAATHTEDVAGEAVRAVTARRAQFRASHVDTAVSTVLKGYRFGSDADRDAAHRAVMDHAMREHAVQLTPPETLALPDALTGETGAGVDRRANAEKYTTAAVLEAEKITLDGARTPVAVFTADATVERALARHEHANGWALNAGQAALARHLLTSGTLVAAGVGPAGTGKTASMKLVAAAWQDEGRNVIGLAPSAAAASVLEDEIGARSHTIDSLTFTWRGLHPSQPGKTLSALPVQINPGDMLLVDEAGMSSTENLAALTEIAAASGAVVRLIGDPKQLAAVETGGLFGEVARTPGTVELREVMRMGSDTAQAEATLSLRDGDPDALALYTSRGWVHGGSREQMLTEAVAAFQADTEAGRRSLIIASRNADVDTMNEIIRADRIAAGLVDDSREATVARGDTVGVGDTVIARKNALLRDDDGQPMGRVINGQMFTVTGLTETGDLAVRDHNTGTDSVIPASYAGQNVHLGYASTIHRAQGATVDTTHAVLDTSVDRAGLYVALTRGKNENRAYAVCEPTVDAFAEDAHLHSAGDHDAPTPRQVLEIVLARDTRERSATETLREELANATSPERLEALYRHGADLAAAAFTAETLPAYLDALPRALATPIETNPDQRAAVERAWTDAALAGEDPRQVWTHATDGLEAADRPGALLAHRIREATAPRDGLPTAPPATAGGDSELAAWLATARDALTTRSGSDPDQERLAVARELIASSSLARLDDQELATRHKQAHNAVKQARRTTEHAEKRLANARRIDSHQKDVLRRHADLDARAEAIRQAAPIAEQLRHVRDELRRADGERRRATAELAGLGPLAVRRRAAAQQRLDAADAASAHWRTLEQHLLDQARHVHPDPGPEHTWNDVLTRAADTERRRQELDDAVRRDRVHEVIVEPDVLRAHRTQHRAETTLADLAGEIHRRRALTDTDRAAENTARTEHRGRPLEVTLDVPDPFDVSPVSASHRSSEPGTGYGSSPTTSPFSGLAPAPDPDLGPGL